MAETKLIITEAFLADSEKQMGKAISEKVSAYLKIIKDTGLYAKNVGRSTEYINGRGDRP